MADVGDVALNLICAPTRDRGRSFRKAYAFTLDYAVVTFPGTLSGDEARQFFDRLGTIDAALWSGQFAGFTQIDFGSS